LTDRALSWSLQSAYQRAGGPRRSGYIDNAHNPETIDERQERAYALGVLGLGSLLQTQVRYEHPASIKDAEAQELATREAADMRRADSASAQLIRDGLDGLPADPTGLN